MMNDEEFREKCRKISCQQLNELDEFLKCHKGYAFDPEVAITIALFYIAANMPSPDESDEKPCKYCDGSEPRNSDGVSHYIYIDGDQKELVDVCDGKISRVEIKYCPLCSRKL